MTGSVAADLHTSESAAGQMVTLFALCYALAAPVFATAPAGRPAKTILTAALLLFTVANALTALACKPGRAARRPGPGGRRRECLLTHGRRHGRLPRR